jgi:hypothetical protein
VLIGKPPRRAAESLSLDLFRPVARPGTGLSLCRIPILVVVDRKARPQETAPIRDGRRRIPNRALLAPFGATTLVMPAFSSCRRVDLSRIADLAATIEPRRAETLAQRLGCAGLGPRRESVALARTTGPGKGAAQDSSWLDDRYML